VRALGVAVALLAAASSGRRAPLLVRLADAVAQEVVRVAGGRAVEIAIPEDRTGSLVPVADLQALVGARLSDRVALADFGPRRRIVSVLSKTGGRLVLSGRVFEEPGGRLVDLLSASVEAEPELPVFDVASQPDRREVADVRPVARVLVPFPVLDLAFVGDDRLLVLAPDAVTLWRRDEVSLRLESRHDLPANGIPVRRPGGRLQPAAGESACWAMTSRDPRATLLNLDGGRLRAAETAEAVPGAGLPRGLRLREGTNLLEALVPGLGEGPFLAIVAAGDDGLWAVASDGRLGHARKGEGSWTDVRVGPALAVVWPGLLAAASPDPPSASDRVVLLALEASGARPVGGVPIEGCVRALASRRSPSGAVLAVGSEEAEGWRVVLVDLGRPRP
jgi:hypothetical protein